VGLVEYHDDFCFSLPSLHFASSSCQCAEFSFTVTVPCGHLKGYTLALALRLFLFLPPITSYTLALHSASFVFASHHFIFANSSCHAQSFPSQESKLDMYGIRDVR
jgi:hypothetical protein